MADILDAFGLTAEQRKAVTTEGVDVVVTAGAGSGKTRTLVARYLWHLERGLSPRAIVAITFTEKAAREMRNRIRNAIGRWVQEQEGEDAGRWRALEAGMDAARIGTIHSLCAEILRNHPAEAGVDPQFEVIEEGTGAALRAQAVEDALIWALGDGESSHLFVHNTSDHLRRMLTRMLLRRLDLGELDAAEFDAGHAASVLSGALKAFLSKAEVTENLDAVRSLGSGEALEADAGEKLAAQIRTLLEGWPTVEAALEAGDVWEAAGLLFKLRRESMALNIGKKSSTVKEHLRALRDAYDADADPWLGGAKSSSTPPDAEAEGALAGDLPRLFRLYQKALANYRTALDRLWSLDFDDLEGGALALLEDEPVQSRWAGTFEAVLVDEFQDTNSRQRAIVDALTSDRPGKLFVVGDARQSIYRFRGADVAVFRAVQQDVAAHGGELVELDLTFRTHQPLLDGLDGILPAFMGSDVDPTRPYVVPYTQLTAQRESPGERARSPHVELVLGLGDRADDARPQAAQALAARLLQMMQSAEINAWDEVTLLFRASTGFPYYEAAFEAAGIPFVTIAGGGFYERPEVRDLLNILQALAEPWDDAAMAGLLRSPAIGVSDAGLYRLRWGSGERRPFLEALSADRSALSEADQAAVLRAGSFLDEFSPLVERVRVAELLKHIVDRLDLRALLATGEARLWRNVDKLLDDARTSGLVRVGAFFQYLRTLREVGAREGEAPVEAVGAVRLMTIHKSKGLEFNVVVLADASRQPPSRGEPVYVQPELGLAWKPDRVDVTPVTYAIARWVDEKESAAEENRVLYVAMTRAREKLIISGHLTLSGESWSASGWTKALLDLIDVDPNGATAVLGRWQTVHLEGGAQMGVYVAPPEQEAVHAESEKPAWPRSSARSLVPVLSPDLTESMDDDQATEPSRGWRATGVRTRPPAEVLGVLVHAALSRWWFPGDERFDRLVESLAYREGLVNPGQRRQAIEMAAALLKRLSGHPVFGELEEVERRMYEVPYTYSRENGRVDSGRIDLLYKVDGAWQVLDFKTDHIRDEDGLQQAVEEYRTQMGRYRAAVERLLGDRPVVRLCFLDAIGGVRLVQV